MTPRIIDTKKLGLNDSGSMGIQCIATNSTASWVYLGRRDSLDRHYLNLIACEMDTVTGEPIGEPIFLPDSTKKSDLGQIRIGKIIVDESKNLLYLCRAIAPGLDKARELEARELEAITVYELDPSGRPMGIVATCNADSMKFPGATQSLDGVYNIAIHQNHLYAVGRGGINGLLIYKLDNQGIPITTTPTDFFPTAASQQVEIFNDKIYLGTTGISPILEVVNLDAQGIPIFASIQTFPIPIGIANEFLDFQISNKGIYPQKDELLKSNRPLTRSLFFLPFDANGLPVLPVQTLPVDGRRGFGVNANDELWLATDDTYNDVLNGSSGNKGIKLTKKDSIAPADNLSIKLKFTRLVCVAENGTPVLLCDSAGVVDFGNQSIVSGWYIHFKVNQASYRQPTTILPEGIKFSLEGYFNALAPVRQLDINLKPGNWSENISLNKFLESTRQPIIFKLKLPSSSFVDPKLSRLEVEIKIYDGLPGGVGVKEILLPPETTAGDLVEFWLPGYGVQDLPDLKAGESALEQRYSANLIEWASQRVQRYLTELRAISRAAVQPKQYSVSPYGIIGWQPSRLQLQTTAELLEYMGFNSSEITKFGWTGLDANEINTAVVIHLPYRDAHVSRPLSTYNIGIPETITQTPLCYFNFFLSEPTLINPILNLWVNSISSELFKNGATSGNIRTISIADEPGWEINSTVCKIRASTKYTQSFREFLKAKLSTYGLTLKDLGVDAPPEAKTEKEIFDATFGILLPAFFTLNKDTLINRRFYYLTVRFLVESASDAFGSIAQLMRGYLAGVNQPNLFTPVNKSNFGGLWAETGRWYGGGNGEPDWFDLGRKNVPAICAENWSGDNFGTNLSYTANLMRCAANLGSEKSFGAYIRGLRLIDPIVPTYAVMTYAGYGCKNFTFFNYGHGPYQGDSWSEYPELYPAIRNALDMLGQAEDLLYPGKPPSAQVAVLHPGASDLWNELGTTCLYQVEAHGIYHALRHAGYAVDLIDEIELKDKFFIDDGYYKDYRILYITGPNIPRSAIDKLKAWVVAGNTLVVTNGAAMRDEYHEKFVSADGLDELLGLTVNSRSEDRTQLGSQGVDRSQYIKIDDLSYGGYAEFLPATHSYPLDNNPVNWTAAKTIASGKNNGVVFATEHQIDPIKQHKAITFGMYFGAAYMLNYGTDSYQSVETRNTRPTNWNPILRKLIVAPVEQLGIAKPVEIDQNLEIECCRLDSTAGIGIVLLNWSGKKAENLTFKVTDFGAFTNVKSVKQGILVANVVGANLEIELPSLETVDVLLIT
jgi:hypothetical protein